MKKLSYMHRFMARSQALENSTPVKLRELTGYSEQQVYRIIHDPLFIAEVDRLVNKVEEYAIAKRNEAMDIVYKNLNNIVQQQVDLAKSSDSDVVKSNACDKLMSFVYSKKDVGKEEDDKNKYVMVQLSQSEGLKDDPDVSPEAAKAISAANVVQFKEVVNEK